MKANQFVPGYVSQSVKVESSFTDYELAIMEGGLSLDKPKSALHQAVSIVEAFDKPYEILRWETGDFGDVDAIARLDDNTFLSIMFNKGFSQDTKEEAWSVEFYRNNSQEVTGEGDSQRVFATVLSAIQTFIKKYKPNRITFTASKEVEQGQNAQSRARLYDSLVQRYARSWGFRAFRADTGNKVIYELNRIQPVTENFADGKVKGKSRPGRVKRSGASCDGSVSDLRSKAKNASGERAKMYHWCANMKSGRAKTESEILEDLEESWKHWTLIGSKSMKIKEIINEGKVGEITTTDFHITVDSHAIDQLVNRKLSPISVDKILKGLNQIKDDILNVEEGYKFWVWNPDLEVGLGMRKSMGNNRLLLATMVGSKPYDGPVPIFQIGTVNEDQLNELVYKGYPCTKDCSGHAAGDRWADARNITDPNQCPYSNNSFWEGCLAHTDEQE